MAMSRKQERVSRSCWLAVLVAVACSSPSRDNALDPLTSPVIDLSAPVVDDGTILLRWRYYSEGSGLEQFQISRTTAEDSSAIGTLDVAASIGWQSATFRDSALVAGVNVQYQVAAVVGGVVTAVVSGGITVKGTVISATPDAPDLSINLEWSDAPQGVVGYELIRSAGDEQEILFATQDITRTSYRDRSLFGDTTYEYQIRTMLSSGRAILSDPVRMSLFAHDWSEPTLGLSPGNRYIIYAASGNIKALAAGGQRPVIVRWAFLFNTDGGTQYIIDLPSSDTSTLSATELSHPNTSLRGAIVGLNTDGTVFFAALEQANDDDGGPNPVPTVYKTWPATGGGSRTGVAWASDLLRGQIVFYEGTTLRWLDQDFELIGEASLPTGEPIGIAFQAGSLWLAYQDRLVRSNDTFVSAGVTGWEQVSIPTGVTVTSLSRIFEDKLLILDGLARKLYVVDLQGTILISWDARGANTTQGDAKWLGEVANGFNVYQTDGNGFMHEFTP
jgi:hypothetical protein